MRINRRNKDVKNTLGRFHILLHTCPPKQDLSIGESTYGRCVICQTRPPASNDTCPPKRNISANQETGNLSAVNFNDTVLMFRCHSICHQHLFIPHPKPR